MSYTTNITEEITIRNTSAKAAHIAAQIHHYLQELDSMSYIGRFLIVHAALDADGNHVEVRDPLLQSRTFHPVQADQRRRAGYRHHERPCPEDAGGRHQV